MLSEIKNAWDNITNKHIESTQYVEKFQQKYKTYTINGYMGQKDCDTLVENLSLLFFKEGEYSKIFIRIRN